MPGRIMMSASPVIVIGMHRSGTSLVSRLLGTLGVFMGFRQESNAEATFFLKLNRWIYSQSGTNWDRPLPVRDLVNNDAMRTACLAYIRRMVTSGRIVEFTGPGRYRGKNSLTTLRQPWGWKDPRNTFTLPLWLDLYPEARVVHVYRNGVDVARSLVKRGKVELDDANRRLTTINWLNTLRIAPVPRKGRGPLYLDDEMLVESIRGMYASGAFEIWEEYVTEAEEQMRAFDVNRVCNICYETLLTNPDLVVTELSEFLHVPATKEQIALSTSRINKGRANAYQLDEEWLAFFDTVKTSSLMQKLNYS